FDVISDSFPKILFQGGYTIKVEGRRILNGNFLDKAEYTTEDKIELLFDGYLPPDEDASCIEQINNINTEKISNPPPFPSRVVYTGYKRDGGTDKIKHLLIKPALTSQIDNDYSYKIVLFIGEKDTLPNEDVVKGIFSSDSEIEKTNSYENKWKNSSNYYHSSWIKNSCNTPLTLSTQLIDSARVYKKYHFFVKLRYNNGTANVITGSMRHSVLMIDDNFKSFVYPCEIFSDTVKSVEYHENIVFTSDVFIPNGYTMTFGAQSSLDTSKSKKLVAGVSLDNNIKIVVEGSLIIKNNLNGSGFKRIFFGPSGVEDSNNITIPITEEQKTNAVSIVNANGMWSGIYVLDTGFLDIDGANITGAYDGIVLYNNINKSKIKNCTIKYNEVGLHLYNSELTLTEEVVKDGEVIKKDFETINIEGNILYGIKEDANSKINIQNFSNIKFYWNGYNYYKDGEGVVK
ncbi:MAG TPA: hypothetical protein PK771_04245, partial [Spirochaetota bacterium]|nr:hypothetical protein [Spirochaetota bacterium]